MLTSTSKRIDYDPILPAFVVHDDIYYVVTSIGDDFITEARTMKMVTIPDDVEYIGNYAFQYNYNLEKVILSKNLKYIGDRAFNHCGSLETIELPEGLEHLGSEAFRKCESIKSMNIPESTTFVGSGAFEFCFGLKNVTLPSNLKEIGAYAFNQCSSLETAELPDGLTTVPEGIFESCEKLSFNHIPSKASVIGKRAFYDCKTMWIELDFGPNLTKICDEAFRGCKGIKTILMQDSVKFIGERVFSMCENVIALKMSGNIEHLSGNAFYKLKFCDKNGKPLSPSIDKLKGKMFSRHDGKLWEGLNSIHADGILYMESLKGGNNLTVKDCSPKTSVLEIPGTISHNGVEYTVTAIGNGVFENRCNLNEVTLPPTVTDIGKDAFKGCNNLGSINNIDNVATIGDGAFQNCSTLEMDLLFDQKLTCIGNNAFEGCIKLKKAALPEGVKHIGDHAFRNCTSLASAYISDKTEYIGKGAFEGCTGMTDLTIPISIESGGMHPAFKGCCNISTLKITPGKGEGYDYTDSAWGSSKHLKTVTFLEGVISIGDSSFRKCKTLETVQLPSTLKSIGEMAFAECEQLMELCLPEGLRTIEKRAFSGCIALEVISFPHTLDEVGDLAFEMYDFCNIDGEQLSPTAENLKGKTFFKSGNTMTYESTRFIIDEFHFVCISPEDKEVDIYMYQGDAMNLTIPGTVSYNDVEYTVTHINEKVFKNCTFLKSVKIPSTVKHIGEEAFRGCKYLYTVDYPEDLVFIGKSAFEDCCNLNDVILKDKVESVGDYAFKNCEMVKEVVLPDALTHMGKSAFKNCHGMKKLKMPISLDAIANGKKPAFEGCCNLETATFTPGTTVGFDYDENKYTPWRLSKNTLTSIIISEGVSSIGDEMFKDCKSLVTLVLPDSLRSIGEETFEGCTSIHMIRFPDNLEFLADEAFEDLTFKDENVGDIPATAENLRGRLFLNSDGVMHLGFSIPAEGGGEYIVALDNYSHCSILEYRGDASVLEIPERIHIADSEYLMTQICNGAFANNETLVSVTIPCSITDIKEDTFRNCLNLENVSFPEGFTAIGRHAFKNCTSLDIDLTLIPNLNTIESGAFYGCNGIKSLVIHDYIKSVKGHAFKNCKALAEVVITEYAGNIGKNAFKDCTALKKLSMPISVNSVGYKNEPIFEGCTNIREMVLTKGDGVGFDYSNDPFNSVYYEKTPWYYSKDHIETVVVSEGVTVIGKYMFRDCKLLKSVSLPSTIVSINKAALSNCTSLKEIKMPEMLENLGERAFEGCTSLESLTIPDRVTSIGDSAFYGCTALSRLVFGDALTYVGYFAFGGLRFQIDGVDVELFPKNLSGRTWVGSGTDSVLHLWEPDTESPSISETAPHLPN